METLPIKAFAQEEPVKKRILWIPVALTGERVSVKLYSGHGGGAEPVLWRELTPRTGLSEISYYAPLDVTEFAGQSLMVECALGSGWLERVRIGCENPPVNREGRPKLHFTADRGWINDPNGLIAKDGLYHLYFQYNPFDLEWGDMHWGHAVSRDLLHWEQQDTALFPDESGTMYSGCAFFDSRNLLGYGENSALFYYTAAGGKNTWSAGKPFTQKIAVLPAGAPENQPLKKTGIVAVDWIAEENRDPKVFWHEDSKSFVMVLYLAGNDFAVFRSENLEEWKLSQRLTLEGAWECPDLVCLPVEALLDGRPQPTGEERWIFWSADGYYFTGAFDGFRFTPDGERQSAYRCSLPYAAQTYQGTPGRTVSVAWLRTEAKREEGYTGMMAVPVELSLLQTVEGLRLRLPPVRELDSDREALALEEGLQKGATVLFSEPGAAFEVRLRLPLGEWTGSLQFGKERIGVDAGAGTVTINEEVIALPRLTGADGEITLSLLCDGVVSELRAAFDTLYYVWEHSAIEEGAVTLTLSQALPGGRAEGYRL